VINDIMQIFQSTYFGKYHFEVALVLTPTIFLST
jgi:hypothetical protein